MGQAAARRTTRKKRTSKRRPQGLTARKGLIVYRNLKAREYTGGDPMFKGRIQVDRGSGMLEFPAPHQFGRIAREEGVPKEDVRRAFGHMKGLKKLKKNAKPKRTIRRGLLFYEGDDDVFEAREVDTPPELLARVGSPKAIAVDVGGVGMYQIMTPEQTMRRARRFGFRTDAFKTAFGHLLGASMAGATGARRVPTVYGPRVMKLGHYKEGETVPRSGIRKGQLLLFHKPRKMVVWTAIENTDPKTRAAKPVRVKVGATSRAYSVGKALELSGEHNIPPLAFLQAFGDLIHPEDLAQLYRQFSS